MLVGAAGRNANFLLNIGPMPDGTIPAAFQERLAGVGAWLARHGESIYGTRGGPIAPRPWGVTTQKPDTVYVHVLDWADPELALPPLPRRVRAARLVGTTTAVVFRETADGIALRLPPRDAAVIDQVIALALAPAPAARP
jgi:alpha-L-fucosidase